MTQDQHRLAVALYRAAKGKATPAEYMAYMWSRQALGEPLSAGQRGFLAAAQKPAWHGQPAQDARPVPVAPPARAVLPPKKPAADPTPSRPYDDVPAWVTEDEQ